MSVIDRWIFFSFLFYWRNEGGHTSGESTGIHDLLIPFDAAPS